MLIPPMLTSLILTGMASIDSREFIDHGPCPVCGGEVSGYDMREKFFATIIDAGVTRDIRVRVKRFKCRSCGKLSYARSPFYPGTRLGSPVVDLCVTFSGEMPYNRVAEVLGAMGIMIDRGTVRNYATIDFGGVPTTELFGLRLPLSVLSFALQGLGF